MNKLAGIRGHNVNPKNLVGLLLSQNLDKPFGTVNCLGSAVCHEWEFAHPVVNTQGFHLLLGLPYRSHLRARVHNPRHRVIVHMSMLPCYEFHTGNSILLSLVGQHRARDNIPDGIDSRNISGKSFIHQNPASFVHFNPNFFQPKPGSEWCSSCGNKNDIGFKCGLLSPSSRLHC
uniref:Uncharacterized protein n=1 Tax=Opuntia streptacantha TaxID=393608 RepID=A0A7C9CKF2_OPUST